MEYLLLLLLLSFEVVNVRGLSTSLSTSLISIRGAGMPQSLPASLAGNWRTWTFDSLEGVVTPVEGAGSGGGWVNPTSFDQLFLPADLPPPLAQPALGLAVTNGQLRYAMPSAVTSLETPARVWRNRGLCSLPRANVWLDLHSPYMTDSLRDLLVLTMFGKSAPDVRFLEDQDGTAAWESAILQPPQSRNTGALLKSQSAAAVQSAADLQQAVVLQRHGFIHLRVVHLYERLKALLETNQLPDELYEGFHFVDIPVFAEDSGVVPSPVLLQLPQLELQGFLGSFPDTSRLLELEEAGLLDMEPLAQMHIRFMKVAAGGKSEFLPEVYRDLYEEGNILFS